ncbi:unnamed protein product [Sphagnum jensenii]
MLMLPAPAPDQILMRCLIGESQRSHQQACSAPFHVVGVIPTFAEPTGALLTPSFFPFLHPALFLPSHMRNITLNSGGEQHHHHHRSNSEVTVAGVSIDMRSMNGSSSGYPFPTAPWQQQHDSSRSSLAIAP